LNKYKPLPAGLAFLFLAFLLVSLAARFWAGEQGYRFTGPTHIAAGQGQVWVYAAGDLYRLSAEGELSGVFSAQTTGLESDPIDLGVMPDGRLLVAEQDPARIRLCDTDSWQCDPVLPEALSVIKRQFKAIVGNQPGEWLITDARGDMLWGADGPGIELLRLLAGGILAGPNGLIAGEDGTLWIADTDNRRLIEFLPDHDGLYRQGREHSAVNELTVGERWYPMMLAQTADGILWVAQAADFSKAWSDLVAYDPEEGVQAVIELPQGAYATDLAVAGDQLLVTDLERFVIYRVDPESMSASPFGGVAFLQRMQSLQESRIEYDRMGIWALMMMLVSAAGMILFAILATPKGKRLPAQPALFDPQNVSGEVPQTRRVHWLERDPKAEQIFKWGERAFNAALVLLVVTILVFYAWINFETGQVADAEQISKTDELGIILLLGGVMVALLIPVVGLSKAALFRKQGTDGKRLFISLEVGGELAGDPTQLVYTNRMVHYRKYTIPLQGGNRRALYLPGELDTWLAPLLRNSRKISALQAMQHQWKYRDSLLIWTLIAATAAGLLLLAINMLDG
jgi:hypothetical protein